MKVLERNSTELLTAAVAAFLTPLVGLLQYKSVALFIILTRVLTLINTPTYHKQTHTGKFNTPTYHKQTHTGKTLVQKTTTFTKHKTLFSRFIFVNLIIECCENQILYLQVVTTSNHSNRSEYEDVSKCCWVLCSLCFSNLD